MVFATSIFPIPVGNGPIEVTANPMTNKIYVANSGDDTVSVIDGNTDTVIDTITVDDAPAGITVNPATNKIYIANFSDATVSVIADIIPPTISPVSDITRGATNLEDTIVDYALPNVTDDTDSNPTISCNPSPGSLFPIGTTTVICTAQDATGNTSTVEFDVIVQETFCNDLTIDQLKLLFKNNVIDNRDGSLGNILIGTIFGDLILASDAGNTIFGGAGSDCIIGGTGNDIINGNLGDDTIFGRDGSDWLVGGFGNDRIRGGTGNDEISGGFGNDAIAGEAGNDTIQGQLGNDSINGGPGDDSINGGFGSDTCVSDGGDTTPAVRCEL